MAQLLGATINPLQEEVEARQEDAISSLYGHASDIPGVNNRNQAVVRDILPSEDLQIGGDNGWNGNDREWIQSGLTGDSQNEIYTVNSNNRAQDKVYLIYGAAAVSADVLTSEIVFQDGTNATFRRYNVETLDIVDISDVILFEEDIVYGVTQDGAIDVWATSGGTDEVILLGKVLEARGQTVTPRDEPSSVRGGA